MMEKAVEEKKVKKEGKVEDPRSIYDHVRIPEDSDKARWSCVGSALHSLQKSITGHTQKSLKSFLVKQAR